MPTWQHTHGRVIYLVSLATVFGKNPVHFASTFTFTFIEPSLIFMNVQTKIFHQTNISKLGYRAEDFPLS